LSAARIGKAALAKPVMEAMGNVPRHEFVAVLEGGESRGSDAS
jgi:protein-L-isoaspartate O-methyltransferase